jgi:hypothetical protein
VVSRTQAHHPPSGLQGQQSERAIAKRKNRSPQGSELCSKNRNRHDPPKDKTKLYYLDKAACLHCHRDART